MEVYIPSVKSGFPLGRKTTIIFFFPFSFLKNISQIFYNNSLCLKWEQIKFDKSQTNLFYHRILCPEFWHTATAAITENSSLFQPLELRTSGKAKFQTDVLGIVLTGGRGWTRQPLRALLTPRWLAVISVLHAAASSERAERSDIL